MTIIGSAVGFGNIWRFPYLVGENGGGAFLLLYLGITIAVGLPLMLSEFIIGKKGQSNCVGSFKKLSPNSSWHFIGYISIITGFAILGFYSVIGGWTIFFFVDSITGAATTSTELSGQNFNDFINSAWKPALISLGFVATVGAIVLRGVEKGIEKANKILMPFLVVILVVLAINSLTLDGAKEGLTFLFKPDFSVITFNTFLAALGQVFFTLSIGMGVIITFSSYVKKEYNMLRTQLIVITSDTLIAILAGVVIFPAVFSFGLNPSEGPTLAFVVLPTLFAQMTGGAILASLFFLMLFIAAVTSAISILEMVTAFMVEHYKISRLKAIIIPLIVIATLAMLSALSQSDKYTIEVLGLNLFDFLDTLSANYLMTFAALLTVIFAGWKIDRSSMRDAFTSGGKYNVRIFSFLRFMIRYVVPLVIAVIMLSEFNII